MSASASSNSASSTPLLVLIHGGGGPPFHRSHPLVVWARSIGCDVMTPTLPLHASNARREGLGGIDIPTADLSEKNRAVQSFLDEFFSTLRKSMTPHRMVVIVGYSTGGLAALAVWDRLRVECELHPSSCLILIGTALRLGTTQQVIQQYWQPTSFPEKQQKLFKKIHVDRKWMAANTPEKGMDQSQHKQVALEDDESWKRMVEFISFGTGDGRSSILLKDSDIARLFRGQPAPRGSTPHSSNAYGQRIFFIQGAKEVPFPVDECIIQPLRSILSSTEHGGGNSASIESNISQRVRVVRSDHHSYFKVPRANTNANGNGSGNGNGNGNGNGEKIQERSSLWEDVRQQLDSIIRGYTDLPIPSEGAASSTPHQSNNSLRMHQTSGLTSASPLSSLPPLPPPRRILVVGCGAFGLSAASGLAARYPPSSITILDSARDSFNNPLAASQDLSRIVRPDYGDDFFYTQKGIEAIAKWKHLNAKWGEEVYKETGVLFLTQEENMRMNGGNTPDADSQKSMPFEAASFMRMHSPPHSLSLMPLQPLQPPSASATPTAPSRPPSSILAKHFPYWHASQSSLRHGYYNPTGGHVHPTRAIQLTLKDLLESRPNVELKQGVKVVEMVTEEFAENDGIQRSVGARKTMAEGGSPSLPSIPSRRIVGVRTSDGEFIGGDLVVVATGSWTSRLLPELAQTLRPSNQPIFYIRPANDSIEQNPTLAPAHNNDVRHGAINHSNNTLNRKLSIYSDATSRRIAWNELVMPRESNVQVQATSASFESSPSPSSSSSASWSPFSSRSFPVFSFDLSRTGFYGFPLDPRTGTVKIAHHGIGIGFESGDGNGNANGNDNNSATSHHQHTMNVPDPDAPRTLPPHILAQFTSFLRRCLPHLYQHGELVEARTCFYCDSFDGHWLCDFHPDISGLFVAGGDSGHGFKFLPVLPDVLGDLITGVPASSSYAPRFCWRLPSPALQQQLDVCRAMHVAPAQDDERVDDLSTSATLNDADKETLKAEVEVEPTPADGLAVHKSTTRSDASGMARHQTRRGESGLSGSKFERSVQRYLRETGQISNSTSIPAKL